MCRQIGFAFVCLFAISSAALAGDPTPSAAPGAAAEIDLLFTYGSEKKTWIDAATAKFHEKHFRISSGEEIRVKADPMGSGEIIDELLAGSRQVHLVSPAASAYFVMGNAASSERSTGDLVGEPELLVKSPIIIAIWSEMAEAIGWPGRRIHWRGFFDHARALRVATGERRALGSLQVRAYPPRSFEQRSSRHLDRGLCRTGQVRERPTAGISHQLRLRQPLRS